MTMANRRRAVVTGVGSITSLGLNTESTWANLIEGKSGVRPIDTFDVENFPARIAALVSDFDPTTIMSKPEARKSDPFVLYGIWAAHEALAQAGFLDNDQVDLTRVGLAGDPVGVPIGGGVTAVEAPLLYPYYPKQLQGLMGGLLGAAEYEALVTSAYPEFHEAAQTALVRMFPQTVAHLVIVAFVVLGNISYFATRSRERRR